MSASQTFQEDLISLRKLHLVEETLAIEDEKKEAALKALEAEKKKDTKKEDKDSKKKDSKYVNGHFHYKGCPLDTQELWRGTDCDCAAKVKAHSQRIAAMSLASGSEAGAQKTSEDY